MLRCNLSILLAERNLKITTLAKNTKISRTTLTSLANNYSRGIQYETLNTLCNYLEITPNDLISHIPIDIEILSSEINDDVAQIEVEIYNKGISKRCGFCGNLYISYPDSIEIIVSCWDDAEDMELQLENKFLLSTLRQLPISFRKDLENEIADSIIDDLSCEYDFSTLTTPIDTYFTWDMDL